MKKILILLFSLFILSGCATYKFQRPANSGDSGGYLACYDGKPILEYTAGKGKSLPDLTLAKERFKRRRLTVEQYYKQMGQIETRLKTFLWEPVVMIGGFFGGVLRWPFIAVADYKYNHNPKYKAKADRRDEEKEAEETARVGSLRKELDAYIVKDLVEEVQGQGREKVALSEPGPKLKVSTQTQEEVIKTEASTVAPEPAAIKEELVVATPAVETVEFAKEPEEVSPAVAEKAPAVKIALSPLAPPVAVITARPAQGYAPLKVNFSAQKSYSKSRKIVAYLWDFGDGDTSTKKNPENTYWSTTFGSRSFTATLTVRDDAGDTSVASTIIKVITK